MITIQYKYKTHQNKLDFRLFCLGLFVWSKERPANKQKKRRKKEKKEREEKMSEMSAISLQQRRVVSTERQRIPIDKQLGEDVVIINHVSKGLPLPFYLFISLLVLLFACLLCLLKGNSQPVCLVVA